MSSSVSMARPSPDPLFVLRGSKDAVNTLRFYTQNDTSQGYLLSGCAAGEVRLWSLSSRRSEVILNGHRGNGILAVHTLDNNHILSHGRDNQIHTLDVGEGRRHIISSLDVASISLCKSAVCTQGEVGHLIAVAGLEKSEVRVHDLESQKITHRLIPPIGHKAIGMPMSLKFMDSRQLLAGYEDGSVMVWNLETSKILVEKMIHSEPVMCMDYSMTSDRGMSGSAEDKLVSWRVDKDNLESLHEATITNPGVSDVRIRSDNKIAATAGWDNRIRLFGLKKLKPLAILTYHTDSIHCINFSQPLPQFQSQHLLAAGSKDKHISIWSVFETSSR